MGGLTVQRRETPSGALVIACEGDVDGATAPRLDQEVTAALAARRNRLAIDLTKVTYVSSAGVGVLVAALHGCGAAKGGALVLVYPRKKSDETGLARGYDVLEVLDLLGLTEQFTIVPSLAAAEERLRAR